MCFYGMMNLHLVICASFGYLYYLGMKIIKMLLISRNFHMEDHGLQREAAWNNG